MKHGTPIRAFVAPDYCDSCKTTTNHSVSVWDENETTVYHTRRCKSCGTKLNYYSPISFFKLLAAGAITGSIIYFFTSLNLF